MSFWGVYSRPSSVGELEWSDAFLFQGGGCWKRFFFIWEIANVKLRSFISHATLSDCTIKGQSTRFFDVVSRQPGAAVDHPVKSGKAPGDPAASGSTRSERTTVTLHLQSSGGIPLDMVVEQTRYGPSWQTRWYTTTTISHVSDDHKKQEAQLSQKRQCVDQFWP